jgi:hypothetical protein
MGALLATFGLKDCIYGALIAAALAWGGWTYHKYEAALSFAADVKAESAEALKEASNQIIDQNADYTAKLKASQDSLNVQITAGIAQSNALSARLREYEANRCPNAVLPSATAAPAGAAAGPSSVDSAVNGLISAAIHDNAVCTEERAERDALTGK